METVVKCKIEKILKLEEKNAFCIARAIPTEKDFDSKYLSSWGNFSVLGTGYLIEDMEYEFKGDWKKTSYGYTLYFNEYEKVIPNDINGIKLYVQTIKGIGPSTAEKIVEKFGFETINVIEKNPERLLEVKGITSAKLETIVSKFERNKGFENLFKFLSRYGVSPKKVSKIYEHFGDGAEKKINENPYVLCDEIEGISFLTSDAIGRKMDFPLDSYYRIQAGIKHLLKISVYMEGHVFMFYEDLIKQCKKFFPTIELMRFEEVLSAMEDKEEIKRIDDNSKIYITKMFKMEDYVAYKTIALCNKSSKISNIESLIKEVEKENSIIYDVLQIEAINIINSGSSFNIITGGPGTGKSTIIKAILSILKKDNPRIRIKLAAPTGRAAKRMEEATGHSAKTIHRLLEANPMEGFRKNSNDPIDADYIIIDEGSMIDLELFNHLINAIELGTRLIVVGDSDQLPPVGAGYVFRDLIESQIVPVVKLNKVFRQGEGSIIKINAKNIREGQFKLSQEKNSFEFYLKEENESYVMNVQNKIINLFKESYKEELLKLKRKDLALYQVQILVPIKKGEIGVNTINSIIQNIINPKKIDKNEIVFWDKDKTSSIVYRVEDKVMQITNDYEKNVFNGDIGIIESVSKENLIVRFENDELVEYDKGEIRQNLILAYAVTVHKSQGSEYSKVIVVTSSKHYIMNQRNLFYTAITRAKNTVYIVGDKRAIAMSIKNAEPAKRNSKLKERLKVYKQKTA